MVSGADTIISRADIADVLLRWQSGELTAADVHEWAEKRYMVVDYDDWEGEDENSVANEILGALDMLDMNLMLPEDIPFYLDFLNTPAGQFEAAHHRFDDALKRIDYGARRRTLKDDPLYAPYCD